MHFCLDVDDTITYAPEFFVDLVRRFEHAQITIVTFRQDLDATRAYLDSIELRYDRIVVSTDPDYGKREGESLHQWKSRFVNELRPDIFFEDMPEVVSLIDSSILVFLPCDEVIRSWISSQLGSSTT